MQVDIFDKEPLKTRARGVYSSIQVLYRQVNRENTIPRNARCICGSGKKWKRCCLIRHEKKTLKLEEMIKDYRGLCIELRRRK